MKLTGTFAQQAEMAATISGVLKWKLSLVSFKLNAAFQAVLLCHFDSCLNRNQRPGAGNIFCFLE